MPADNFRVQFERGTTAEMDAYVGREGEVSMDMERNQLRLHDGVTSGGNGYGTDSVTVDVISWGGSNWNAPAGVVVTKALGDTALRITHNKNRIPTGWFAYDKSASPWVGITPNAVRNIQIVNANEVLITGLNVFTALGLSLTFS